MNPFQDWQPKLHYATRSMAVLAAFSIAMPTAWISISMGLFLLCWIVAGDYPTKLQRVLENPVALWSLPLLLMLVIGITYSSVDNTAAFSKLSKYYKLLYIPLLISVLDSDLWRKRAIIAFMLGMLLVLIISYLQYLGLVPLGRPGEEYTFFKRRIAQNFFMAFAAFLLADAFLRQSTRRWLWGGLFLLACYNLMVMVSGRTGQVVFLALVMLLAFQHWKLRGLIPGILAACLLFLATYQLSATFEDRVDWTLKQVHGLAQGDWNKIPEGSRLELYANTLEIIQGKPVLGHGTGSFSLEYTKIIDRNQRGMLSDNPHSEYLNLTTEIGILGSMLWLILLIVMWKNSQHLGQPWGAHSQALVIAMAIGCLFNSFLMDHGEGGFFVILAGIYFSGLSQTRLRETTE